MKAYLRSDRKVIVDVEYAYMSDIIGQEIYQDINTHLYYSEDELEWKEYYGG